MIALISLCILGTTFILEHFFEIPVCRMCMLERYPYAVATLLGVLFYMFSDPTILHRWARYLLIATFIVSTGLSFYHMGLEHNWFDLPEFCKGSSLKLDTVEALRAQILSQTTVIPCNVVSLRLFFLSLAEWNGITSLILLGASWKLLKK